MGSSSGSISSSSNKHEEKVRKGLSNESHKVSNIFRADLSENETSVGSTLAISDSSFERSSDIQVYFDSSILAEEEFNDSFGEIVISNDPSSFTQLSYSYSISEDEAENVGYQMEHYDNNFNAEVKDVQLCTFLTSLSLFFKGFLSKKENFVTKESTEFKELSLKAEQSYPYVGDSNKVKQATTSKSKSKRSKNRRNVGGSNMVHPLRNDCPFRQSV